MLQIQKNTISKGYISPDLDSRRDTRLPAKNDPESVTPMHQKSRLLRDPPSLQSQKIDSKSSVTHSSILKPKMESSRDLEGIEKEKEREREEERKAKFIENLKLEGRDLRLSRSTVSIYGDPNLDLEKTASFRRGITTLSDLDYRRSGVTQSVTTSNYLSNGKRAKSEERVRREEKEREREMPRGSDPRMSKDIQKDLRRTDEKRKEEREKEREREKRRGGGSVTSEVRKREKGSVEKMREKFWESTRGREGGGRRKETMM